MPSCYLQLCSSQLASQKSPAGLKNPTHHNTESAKHTTFFVRRFIRCDKSRVGPGGCGRLDDPSMRWAGGHKTHQAHPKLASTHSGKPFFPVRHQFLMSAHEARHIFLISAYLKKKLSGDANGVQSGRQTLPGPNVGPRRAAHNPACENARVVDIV